LTASGAESAADTSASPPSKDAAAGDASGRPEAHRVTEPSAGEGDVSARAGARSDGAATSSTIAAEERADSRRNSLLLGVSVAGAPWSLSELDTFEDDLGAQTGLVMFYQDWAHFPDFEPALVDPVLDRGAEVMLTWEPWDYAGTSAQPEYRLSRILDGSHDAHITRWATSIAQWGRPMHLRFAHEMNGSWYPWSEQANGNEAGQYVDAWLHVQSIFDRARASNVSWVWSPMADAVGYTPHAPIEGLYPGDGAVDSIGLDGYNWGTSQAWGSWWQHPAEIFDTTLARVQQMTSKPISITETASSELGGSKAEWIAELFDWLDDHPDIGGVTWFDHDKETDWRVRSSPSSTEAFRLALLEFSGRGQPAC
jgi:hypothetical protein